MRYFLVERLLIFLTWLLFLPETAPPVSGNFFEIVISSCYQITFTICAAATGISLEKPGGFLVRKRLDVGHFLALRVSCSSSM